MPFSRIGFRTGVALLLLLAVLLGPEVGAAQSARLCRNKLVFYLDCSGSMFFQNQKVDHPRENRRITLMEAMVDFLTEMVADRNNGLLSEGDQLAVYGFYSRLSRLFDTPSFDPAKDPEKLKNIGRVISPSGKYLIRESRNPKFFSSSSTDFTNVVRHMTAQAAGTGLDVEGGVKQLIFVILTDGLHETGTREEFRQAMALARRKMRSHIESDKLKIVFVSLAEVKESAGAIDVRSDFETDLMAEIVSVDSRPLDYVSIISTIKRQKNDFVGFESFRLRREPGEPLPSGLDFRLINRSCRERKVEEMYLTLTRLGPLEPEEGHSPAPVEIISKREVGYSATLAPWGGEGYRPRAQVDLRHKDFFPDNLESGRYRITAELEFLAAAGHHPAEAEFPFSRPFPLARMLGLLIIAAFLVFGVVLILKFRRTPKEEY